MILFALSALHRLTQITTIQIPLNMMDQSIIRRACLFCPKFYYYLFKPYNNRRTIWEIITSPVPPDGRKASKKSNRIPCLNATFSCFLSYQVQGTYTNLNQRNKNRSKRGSLRRNPPCILQWSIVLGSSICIYLGNSARAARQSVQINVISCTYTYSIPVSNLKGPYTPLEKIIDSIHVTT